jgi:UDP-2,4-diacetamido-2,4,6-trideoxy-beta-L-altropyranose hydrolase
MNIVIRTDASIDIGTGHVMRCLTLAHALKKFDNEISFVCREHQGHYIARIQDSGFKVHSLPATEMSTGWSISRDSWLGVTWQEDAVQTQRIIRKIGKPDWLVIDHYCLDYRWEEFILPHVEQIMVIDDLADRDHNCQILLDQNYLENMNNRYTGRVPHNCRMLLGPKYALLNPIYAELRKKVKARSGPVRRLLIFFGGSDKYDLTGKGLQAFLNLNRTDIEVDVVLGRNNPNFESIKELTKERTNICIHRDLPNLAELMVRADLALGASGSTTWERLCLGLPSLVVSFGEDQRPIASFLHEMKIITWIGHYDEVDLQCIENVLHKEIIQGLSSLWYENVLSLVDGQGAERIATDKKLLVNSNSI